MPDSNKPLLDWSLTKESKWEPKFRKKVRDMRRDVEKNGLKVSANRHFGGEQGKSIMVEYFERKFKGYEEFLGMVGDGEKMLSRDNLILILVINENNRDNNSCNIRLHTVEKTKGRKKSKGKRRGAKK